MEENKVPFEKTLGPCGQPAVEADISLGILFVVCPAHKRNEMLQLPGTEGTVTDRLGQLCIGCAMNPNRIGQSNSPDSMES